MSSTRWAGLNRIIDGDWGRQYANPEDRFPKNYTSRMEIGLRTRGEERLWEADTTDVYVDFEFDYGDPFFGDLGKPYDNFDFDFQMTFGDKKKPQPRPGQRQPGRDLPQGNGRSQPHPGRLPPLRLHQHQRPGDR